MQEEATKLSKRAKRRAAGEEGSADAPEGPTLDAEASDDEGGETSGSEAPGAAGTTEGAADDAGAQNRQARRAAAAKARARRKREREAASAIGLDATEIVDDALVRFTDKVSRFGRRNWNTIQWIIGIGIIGGVAYQVYTWRRATVNADTSDALYAAVTIENGRIGDPAEQGKANANGIIDPTPIFETDDARRAAAAERYGAVAAEQSGNAAAAFASLGKAGVLLEQGKADEALAIYDQVAASKAAEASPELRGGALEGRALSLETKGDLPGAFAAFEALGNVPGYENRALYQQARIKHAQGDDEASKAKLNALFKNLGAPKAANLGGLPERPEFLRQRAVQLAGVVDPFEKDVQVPKPPMGAEAMQQMLDQLKESGALQAPETTP